ncbi:MAG: phosphatidylglycerophosphatase A [Bacilli bacterium]
MKNLFSRKEMTSLNVKAIKKCGVTPEDIAEIAYNQQKKYNMDIKFETCLESVYKVLSLRDIFHIVQVGLELDRLANENKLSEPAQSIIKSDLGVFGLDEVFGIAIAGIYGVIGETNFGDIDVNKPGIIREIDDRGGEKCSTFLDDIVGAIAAAASTRVAQIVSEDNATRDVNETDTFTIFDFEEII